MTKHRRVQDAIDAGELNQEGHDAARLYAQWHLGYPGWANQILDAYLNPKTTKTNLAIDGMDIATDEETEAAK